MATLNGFLNPKTVSTVKFALSDRFCGEEVQSIQDECTVSKQIGNKVKNEFDSAKFQNCLLAKSVMVPDPNAADLQDAYGVKSPEKLFGKMLTGAEYLLLFNKVSEINGLDKDLSELVEEAKN